MYYIIPFIKLPLQKSSENLAVSNPRFILEHVSSKILVNVDFIVKSCKTTVTPGYRLWEVGDDLKLLKFEKDNQLSDENIGIVDST